MSNEKMREEFEAWAKDRFPGVYLGRNPENSAMFSGTYRTESMHAAWLAWQASQDALRKRQLREQEEFLDHLADYDHEDRLHD